MTKNAADRAVLALIIVMAVLLYGSTANYTGIAIKTSARYVRFLAVFIGVLAVAQLGFSFLRHNKTGEKLNITGHPVRFAGLLIALIVFAILFVPLGFFIPAAVFIPLISVLLGYRNPVVLGATTVGVLAFVYLVFIKLLAVNLPGFTF